MAGKNHQFLNGWLFAAAAIMVMVAVVCSRAPIRGSSDDALIGQPTSPIRISADWSQEWSEDQGTIALFRGRCQIVQGNNSYSADSMVVWAHLAKDAAGKVDRMTIYLENDVRIEDANGTRNEQSHWLELDATRGISLSVRGRVTDRAGVDDPLFKRALQRKMAPTRRQLKQTQLTVPAGNDANPGWRDVVMQATGPIRKIQVSPRSLSSPFNILTELSTDTTPAEQVTRITGGVTIVIEGSPLDNGMDFGTIGLSADRVVIWTDDFNTYQEQTANQKYQVYLEGNIVIRQRDNVRPVENKITANRAFYDARDKRAIVLDAELETYIPELDSSVRLRADRIRQNSEKSFHAQNAWITTSQYGVPGYRVQASDIFLDNRETGLFADNSPPRVDPKTGVVIPEDHYWITALNTQFLVDQFPLFNAPRVSIPAEDITTSTPLQNVSFGLDRIFGVQVHTQWDAFSIFGLSKPDNPRTKLGIIADYMSLRGPAGGLNGNYEGTDSNGNSYFGKGFGYYINDGGVDNLGLDRRKVTFPDANRGILQYEHQHEFSDLNAKLFGEIGFVSDRNVLEEYRESIFDRGKDLETKLQFNQGLGDNAAYSILGRTQFNSIENNTQWLPRGDLYFLGEPLFNNLLNYSSHSSAGYAMMNGASAPTDPTEVFTPLPYMTNASGIVAQTRHEVDLPFEIGPVKFVPYVLGEAAYWGDSFSGDPIGRLYGRTGLRGSLSFQRVFPQIQSEIFNLNGLAHRSVIDAEYSISGTTRNLNEIPQWNEIDDNAQERFRMRFVQDTFGGVLPVQLDPRFYAVRTGAGGTVTAPYGEMVANQQAVRLNWSQRLQTKVGPPDLQRTKDWMTLDLGGTIFPDANRDNFGQTFGLVSSRYAWHVGDRTSILASSLYDFFPNGQQLWSVGVLTQRSLRGSVYVGLRQVKAGPLDSQIATATLSEVLSPKWVVSATTAFDIAQSRSAGQGFTITRVGEWLLVHVGANIDVSKNNVGLGISIEPRLGRSAISSTQLGSLLGVAQPNY